MKKLSYGIMAILLFAISGCQKSENEIKKEKENLAINYALTDWKYKETVDNFSGEVSTYTKLDSTNKQSVGLYKDYISATLIAFDTKDKSENKFQGYIQFSNTTMPHLFSPYDERCIYGNCTMEVKFDGGPIVNYELFEVKSDSSYGMIRNANFFKKAFNARKIEIRIHFYQRGTGTFNFQNDSNFNFQKAKKILDKEKLIKDAERQIVENKFANEEQKNKIEQLKKQYENEIKDLKISKSN